MGNGHPTRAVAGPGCSPWSVALAAGPSAAAAHLGLDALGSGLELRPWRGTSERAVYSHYDGRWIAPRRWVRYDGAPEDLLVAAVAGGLVVAVHGGPVEPLVVAALTVSGGYALARKHLVDVWLVAVAVLPAPLERRLPERFVEA